MTQKKANYNYKNNLNRLVSKPLRSVWEVLFDISMVFDKVWHNGLISQ